ncbi:hypothetical protein V6O07_17490, partial [Arthrospira platensis SPKY2]
MADPISVLDAALRPVVREVAMAIEPAYAGDPDPVVRPSEHADAQANGALPLAKALGRPPREVAEAICERA